MTTQVTGSHITGVKTAKFLSLVRSPANQRAFSVIRSADGVIRRVRRNDKTSCIHVVTFPEGYDEGKAAETIATLGLSAHTVLSEEGAVLAKRSDLQTTSKEGLMPVRVTEDGVTVWLAREDQAPKTDDTAEQAEALKDKIAMSAIRFDGAVFTDKSKVIEWLNQNSVDFDENAIQNLNNGFVLRQSPAVEDVRELEVEQGVVLELQRSDVLVVPESMVAVISETAYGNWGWGQLDFNAFLADRLFCDGLADAQYALNRVIDQICFYSNLPLDLRKELVVRSLAQYADFLTGMMDALPKQLLVSVAQQRSDKTQRGNTMSKPEAQEATTGTTETTPAAAPSAALTREDVVAIVRSVMEGKTEQAPATDAAPAAEAAPAAASESQAITRSDLEAVMQTIANPLKDLSARMERLEGTTVVRSDTTDPKPAGEKNQTRSDAKSDDEIFAGVFGAAIPR